MTEVDVTRRRPSAAAFIAKNATYVGVILAEMAENAGSANSNWLLAVEAASRGDLDRAQTLIIEADIPLDIHVRIERQDARKVLQHALRLLDRELPDDEPASDIPKR